MAGTIGIFICECGTNIKDALDLSAVARYAAGLPGVLFADRLGLLCSADGRAAAAAKIRESGVSLVVFAACSPKEHEPTFRQILADAGLNPFLMQIANIREQCAWSGNDRTASTGKAQRLIRAAAARVLLHEPLTQPEIVCNPDVLVIGAGVAGLTAALTLAQEQRKVYLVEKSPCIGGKVVRFGEVYPHGECAPCMLDPLMDEVLHHPRIDVITLSHVAKVLGYYGNFTATVATAARLIDEKACVGCGMCAGVCPVTVPDEYNEVLNERKAAYIPFAGALPHTAVIDREHCIYVTSKGCTACRDICPAQAVRLDGRDEVREVKAGAIVVATGFDLFDPRRAPRYGYGKVPGVYTPLEFERILNPTGPTEGTVRAAGGGAPRKIVFIHC
ncbi:MAG TPA: FAD-dependent oxidoreductase, partial [bacterium]|nr:FAD-dependent oxidoreductase [bacterium]